MSEGKARTWFNISKIVVDGEKKRDKEERERKIFEKEKESRKKNLQEVETQAVEDGVEDNEDDEEWERLLEKERDILEKLVSLHKTVYGHQVKRAKLLEEMRVILDMGNSLLNDTGKYDSPDNIQDMWHAYIEVYPEAFSEDPAPKRDREGIQMYLNFVRLKMYIKKGGVNMRVSWTDEDWISIFHKLYEYTTRMYAV